MFKRLSVSLFAVGCILCVAGPVSATAVTPKPVITSFTVTPRDIPANGGAVKLVVVASNATSCVFTGQAAKNCSSGRATITDHVLANTSTSAKRGALWVYAVGPGGRTVKKTVSIIELGQS